MTDRPRSEVRCRPRRRDRWGRRLTAAAILLLLAVVLGANGCTGGLAHVMVHAPSSGKAFDPADDPTPRDLARRGVDRQLRVDVGPPDASILTWVIEPDGSSDREPATLVVLHGIQDTMRSMMGIGRWLAGEGYRVVLVDLRGHGRSSGDHRSYGVHESRDLGRVTDALEREGLITGRLGAFGVSYGAAVAVQWAGSDPRVDAVVAVATFKSMRGVVPRYVRMYAVVIGWFMSHGSINDAIDRAGEIGGFDPDRASPIEAITKTKARVLLVHGRRDWKIPSSHAEALHAAAPDHSELFLVERAGHDDVFNDSTGEVGRRILDWLAKEIGPG